MIIRNEKPIVFIGYPNSSMTKEYQEFFKQDGIIDTSVMTPEDFYKENKKERNQYIIAFSLDMKERKEVSDYLDNKKLDCVTWIHDSCVVHFPSVEVGKGIVIASFSCVLQNSKIGDHSFISPYCLISHETKIGKNSVLHPSVKIAGKSEIGNECVFGLSSSVINKVKVCDNVFLGAFSNITKNIDTPGFYIGWNARRTGNIQVDI
jgi:acetyltransferase-like isoleucine patch superfamily enzyme